MAVPSAAQVFTGVSGGDGTGKGSAVILDTAQDFLPYAMQLQQIGRQERKLAQVQKAQADRDWLNIQKSFDPSGVQLRDEKQMMDKLKTWNDELVDLKLEGYSPSDYYGKGGERARQIELEANNLKKASVENQAFRQKLVETIASDKGTLDKSHAAQWLKQYDELPTIEAQQQFRQNNNPVRIAFSPANVAKRIVPIAFETSKEVGDTTVKQSGLDEKSYRVAMEIDLQTPAGQEDFLAWQSNGNDDKTEDDYIDYMAKFADTKIEKKNTVMKDEPKAQTEVSKKAETEAKAYDYNNAAQTGQWGKNFSVTYAPSADGSIDNVSVKYNQGDMPYIQVTDMGGQSIQFQPQKFFTKDGKLFANGFVKGKEEDENGTMKEVIKETAVPFDANATQFMSSMENFNPTEFIQAKKGGGQSAPKMSEQDWGKAWSALKPGETMTGLDGKKYTKK
jgi:hypothetical protein